jgi:copper homeostasis protein
VILEACVESVTEARAAQAGGAARVELCANLAGHGTTPPDTLLAACVRALAIPVFVMARPRQGSFVYRPEEVTTMRRQIARAKALGASGVVTGALTPAGAVDEPAMRALLDAASPLPVTVHRAFDLIRDRGEAIETLVALGAARVLTSGGRARAAEGSDTIAGLVQQAGGRLVVIAGGGVRAHNVRAIVARTGVAEVHAHLTTEAAVRALVSRLRPAGETSG